MDNPFKNWRVLSHVERKRHIYKDHFMQEIRDKCETMEALREAIEGRDLVFKSLYLDVERNISKRTNTDDMYFITKETCARLSPEHVYGIGAKILRVDCKGDRIFAEAMVLDMKFMQFDDEYLRRLDSWRKQVLKDKEESNG